MSDEGRAEAASVDEAQQIIDDAEALLRNVGQEEQAETAPIEPEETPKQDEKPVLDADAIEHGEKSRLGRKVQRIETRLSALDQIQETLRLLTDHLVNKKTVDDADQEPELSELPSAEEVRDYNAWSRRQMLKEIAANQPDPDRSKKAQEEYSRAYMKVLSKEVDPDDDPELYAMLTDPKDLTYNVIHYGDPARDFAKNLAGASKALMSKMKQRKISVLGKGGSVATGVSVSTSTANVRTLDRAAALKGLSKDERMLSEELSDTEFKKVFSLK
jgi:hypothetical protein